VPKSCPAGGEPLPAAAHCDGVDRMRAWLGMELAISHVGCKYRPPASMVRGRDWMRGRPMRIASVFLVSGFAVACGGGNASETDASGDGASNVTVIVLNGGLPDPGIDVIFHAPDGEVVGETTTDAEGVAYGVIVAGAQVTIARSSDLTTFRRVDPGETIRARYEEGGGFLAESTITLPDGGPAYRYVVSNGCDSQGQEAPALPFYLQVNSGCVGGTPASFPVYAVAFDEINTELEWTLDPAVAVSSPEVTLPPWKTDYDTVAVDIVAVPPDISDMSVRGSFQVGEVEFTVAGPSTFEDPSGDQAAELRYPQVDAASYVTVMGFRFDGTRSYGTLEVGRGDAVDQVTYDLGDLLLPRLSDAALDDATPGRPTISWTGAAPDADFVEVTLGNWTIFDAPDGVTAIQAPLLPDALADLRPSAIDFASVAAYEADWLDGYGELKETARVGFLPETRAGTLRVAITDWR